jgi:hypothetical protein
MLEKLAHRLQSLRAWQFLSRVRDRLAWKLVNRFTKGMILPRH